ncbi:hypothetical protein Rs2_03275 [Raphanus sativus]|nr:hypothetical protein Rs2_03275 [Raphanus sativus]
MLKLFTSHHVASRFKNRSSHKLAPRAFLSTLTDSKPTDTVSAKQCLDDCQTVVALPLLRKPLIPGFYMPLYVKDPKVLAALQESKSGQAPYAGAFLLKDDKDASTASSSSSFETVNILDKLKGKELLKKIYQVGTLAQILSIQGEQVILVGRKRLQITEMDKTYDKNDKVIIKATYFEVISTLREVLETTSLWRDQDIGGSNYRKLAESILQKRRRKLTGFGTGIFEAIDVFYQKLTGSGAGIFEANDFNYKKLADFGAGISGTNKHKIQEVLEELDVHKRLVLTLQLDEKSLAALIDTLKDSSTPPSSAPLTKSNRQNFQYAKAPNNAPQALLVLCVIVEAMKVVSLQRLCSSLKPIHRRVV